MLSASDNVMVKYGSFGGPRFIFKWNISSKVIMVMIAHNLEFN